MRPAKIAAALLLCATVARADDTVDARTELAAGIATLKAHHMNTARLDWPAVEAQAQTMLGGKTAATDAYPAIRFVIAQLGEKHTFLINADNAKAMKADKPVGNARPPDILTPEGYPLTNNIGLIALKRHEGSSADNLAYATAGRAAMAAFAHDHACRYIVDLRGNSGGDMYPMIASVQALLGPEPYGYWQGPQGQERAWRLADANDIGEASADAYQRDLQGAAPVAVLIDRDTASAGEFTAIAFEGRPRTRVFGEPSGGYLTANQPFTLPDGAMIALSIGWSTDRTHHGYRDTLVPDEAAPRGQATLDAAIAWLKKQPCRGAP